MVAIRAHTSAVSGKPIFLLDQGRKHGDLNTTRRRAGYVKGELH